MTALCSLHSGPKTIPSDGLFFNYKVYIMTSGGWVNDLLFFVLFQKISIIKYDNRLIQNKIPRVTSTEIAINTITPTTKKQGYICPKHP